MLTDRTLISIFIFRGWTNVTANLLDDVGQRQSDQLAGEQFRHSLRKCSTNDFSQRIIFSAVPRSVRNQQYDSANGDEKLDQMLGKEMFFSPRRTRRDFVLSKILSDVVMTISLYRANEFDPQMEGEGAFHQGSHIGLLEYSLCALLRQQYIRHFRFSALKPSTLMLGEKNDD